MHFLFLVQSTLSGLALSGHPCWLPSIFSGTEFVLTSEFFTTWIWKSSIWLSTYNLSFSISTSHLLQPFVNLSWWPPTPALPLASKLLMRKAPCIYASQRRHKLVGINRINKDWALLFSRTADPLIHHGHHFGCTIHAFCCIYILITRGMICDVELQDKTEIDFSLE